MDKVTNGNGSGGTTSADSMANGARFEGYVSFGEGNNAHSGGGARLFWVPSFRLTGDQHTLHFSLPVGGDVGHSTMGYTLPGGGDAQSAFTHIGPRAVPTLTWTPPWVDRRLAASIGLGLGVGGFFTPSGTTVSLPPSCVPVDVSRGECEPGAGPRSGNAGTTGLIYPRVGSSRGTSGAYFEMGVPVNFLATFARGPWGHLAGGLGVEPGFTQVLPKDGGAFAYPTVTFSLGLQALFDGSAVENPRSVAVPPPPSIQAEQMPETTSETIAGKDAVDPVFDMTLKNGKVLGTLDGTMIGPDGKPASFEFVDKEVKSYPATIRVRITQKPLTPGVYVLNYTITSADKKAQAKGQARFRVSDQPSLKLNKLDLLPSEFYAGNKNVKLKIETSLKDGDKVNGIALVFKRKQDEKDETGTNLGLPPMVFGPLTVGSKGTIELEKLDLSALPGNSGYIVTAVVQGSDGQVQSVNSTINVKPKADLDVKGLGGSYVPGTIAPISLKLSGVDKVKVRVTVMTTTSVKPAPNKPQVEEIVIDSQIVEVTSAKEEKVALRCQTADKKTVMIAEGGKSARTGNYSVTFEAVNDKGEVIQPLAEPKSFSVATAAPAPGGKPVSFGKK